MEFTDFMLWRFIVIVAGAFIYGFWMAWTGR